MVAYLVLYMLICFLYAGHIALPAIDFMSPLTLPNIIERPEWRTLLSKSSKFLPTVLIINY